MTDLKHKARLALEGSDRSDEAMANIRDYLDDLNDRTLVAISDVGSAVEIRALLRLLASIFDPDGTSPYRLEVVQRKATGRPPNPLSKRYREQAALFAALFADKLLRENPALQKKFANSRAAEAFKITIPEIYQARRTENFQLLSAAKL